MFDAEHTTSEQNARKYRYWAKDFFTFATLGTVGATALAAFPSFIDHEHIPADEKKYAAQSIEEARESQGKKLDLNNPTVVVSIDPVAIKAKAHTDAEHYNQVEWPTAQKALRSFAYSKAELFGVAALGLAMGGFYYKKRASETVSQEPQKNSLDMA